MGFRPIPLRHRSGARRRSVPLWGPACCAGSLEPTGGALPASVWIVLKPPRHLSRLLRQECSLPFRRRSRGRWYRRSPLLPPPLFPRITPATTGAWRTPPIIWPLWCGWPSARVTTTLSPMPPLLCRPWRICGPGSRIPRCPGPAEGRPRHRVPLPPSSCCRSRSPWVLSPHCFPAAMFLQVA